MNVYAQPGQSFQQVGGTCPDGWITMQGERPGPEYTASESGAWLAPSFEGKQAAKIAQINADFASAAAALTDGYPEAERLTWGVQQSEAFAWAADSDAPTPYLDGLAAARGIAPEEMRQKTLEQTQLFMAASQQLVGTRQRLRDLVYEAKTPEDLDAIHWPEPEPPQAA
ncbi:MAG TPA: hypothetical protein VNQ97_06785 [Burkholderiaceae bacterium]|nr:hypothetical protein [Burkholderiaceae bacterium]